MGNKKSKEMIPNIIKDNKKALITATISIVITLTLSLTFTINITNNTINILQEKLNETQEQLDNNATRLQVLEKFVEKHV